MDSSSEVPALTPGQKAAGWLLDYAYVARQVARGAVARSTPDDLLTPAAAQPGSPVLMVPGVYENWRFLQPIAARLYRAGHPVHVLDGLGWNTGSIPEAAGILADHLEQHDLTDVTVVAHSKGGLVAKYAMADADTLRRVRHLVAVNSPFAGSWWASYLPLPAIRVFAPRGQVIRDLTAQQAANARITSLYSAFDPTSRRRATCRERRTWCSGLSATSGRWSTRSPWRQSTRSWPAPPAEASDRETWSRPRLVAMADWDWLLASEYGRDRILRSQVDELAAASASASARSARLSSQLASLQGSLDTRLSALSAAFDAYVELGDVREQLAGFGAEAAVRRAVMAAIDGLAAGRTVQPVETGKTGYWLPYATNAVIALVAGTADPAAEEQARTLSREADLFVVVLLGALERGALVADRVPDLLVSDGTLTAAQLVLWRGLLAGLFPEPEPGGTALLEAVGEGWRATLAAGNDAEWRGWVAEHVAVPDSLAQLQWVADLLHGRVLMPLASPDPKTAVPPNADLREVAVTMVAAGADAERDLLVRARELRRRIENPTSGPPEVADQVEVEVRSLVREAFATETDPNRRAVLLGWLRPGLGRAVAAAAAVPSPEPEPIRRSVPGGIIAVDAAGPEAGQLARVRSRVDEAQPRARSRPLVPAAVAGLLAVLAVVGLVAGWSTGYVVLLLVAAVAAAVGALVLWQRRQAARRAIEADRQRIDQVVAEATREATAVESAYRERQAGRARLVPELRAELGLAEPPSST